MKHYWLDANVILRFLTGEPPLLAERAARLMEQADQGALVLHVSELTLAEVVWVLRSFYRRSMDEVAGVLIRLVSAPGITTAHRSRAIDALELARDRNVDYVDAMLALDAAARGEAVVTFDRTDFKRLPVEWLEPK